MKKRRIPCRGTTTKLELILEDNLLSVFIKKERRAKIMLLSKTPDDFYTRLFCLRKTPRNEQLWKSFYRAFEIYLIFRGEPLKSPAYVNRLKAQSTRYCSHIYITDLEFLNHLTLPSPPPPPLLMVTNSLFHAINYVKIGNVNDIHNSHRA